MNIGLNDWSKYRLTLAKLSQDAADEFRDYFFHKNGELGGTGLRDVSVDLVIEVAYAIITKYSEGSAALACMMYDAIAELSGAAVAAAIPAQTATINETAKAINGAFKQSPEGNLIDSVIQRQVKLAAADTTLQNAMRDDAQFAWVPYSDTCPFCMTIASRGWQKISKNTLKNGHAEHIHGHCDCQYAVRFDNKTNVEGYNPEQYKRIYDSYDGKPQDRINAMRREQYAFNKENSKE